MNLTEKELEYLLAVLEDKCHSMRDWQCVSLNRSIQNKVVEEQKKGKVKPNV